MARWQDRNKAKWSGFEFPTEKLEWSALRVVQGD